MDCTVVLSIADTSRVVGLNLTLALCVCNLHVLMAESSSGSPKACSLANWYFYISN